MGVTTVGYMNKKVTVKEVSELLQKKMGVTDVKIELSDNLQNLYQKIYNSSIEYGGFLHFTHESDSRMMFVGLSNECEELDEKTCTVVSLGHSGNSIPLISSVVEEYGGILIPKDTTDDSVSIKAQPGKTQDEFWVDYLQQ